MQRGKFITFEGIEGVGKSTNIDFLAGLIEAQGHAVMKTREPGGTPIAENIRNILKEHGDEPLPDVAELLLMFAARSINVNNAIRPALEAGTWVISDRFTDSTRAYQGSGRGVPRDRSWTVPANSTPCRRRYARSPPRCSIRTNLKKIIYITVLYGY